MRKHAGIISIVLIIISLIPFALALYSDFFSEYFFLISVISYFIAILLAFLAEKGVWKAVAIALLAGITIIVVGFYAFMGIFWNQP